MTGREYISNSRGLRSAVSNCHYRGKQGEYKICSTCICEEANNSRPLTVFSAVVGFLDIGLH